jgi:hypothetical protein
MPIRIAYLVLVPFLVWLGLKGFWILWRPNEAAEDRLQRTIEGVFAGILLGWAIVRWEEDGFRGRRAGEAFFLVMFSWIFFYLSVIKDKNPKD